MRKSSNFGSRTTRQVTFVCHVCERRTRDTGQGVDHLCEDCYEIAGIDNSINDNGFRPGAPEFEEYRPELERRLAHIAKLGGNVEMVKRANDFCWPVQL